MAILIVASSGPGRQKVCWGVAIVALDGKGAEVYGATMLLRFTETRMAELVVDEKNRDTFPRKLRRGLELFDRVYVVQMERLKLTEIYSNDAAFDRVKGIKRVFE